MGTPLPGLPGFGAAGMGGPFMAGNSSGNQTGRAARSGGGGKKQRENLPKESVLTLKSWLYEHIIHPYPTEAEKNTLMQVCIDRLLHVNCRWCSC